MASHLQVLRPLGTSRLSPAVGWRPQFLPMCPFIDCHVFPWRAPATVPRCLPAHYRLGPSFLQTPPGPQASKGSSH